MKNLIKTIATLKNEKKVFKDQLKRARSRKDKLELRYMITYTDLCIYDLESSLSQDK